MGLKNIFNERFNSFDIPRIPREPRFLGQIIEPSPPLIKKLPLKPPVIRGPLIDKGTANQFYEGLLTDKQKGTDYLKAYEEAQKVQADSKEGITTLQDTITKLLEQQQGLADQGDKAGVMKLATKIQEVSAQLNKLSEKAEKVAKAVPKLDEATQRRIDLVSGDDTLMLEGRSLEEKYGLAFSDNKTVQEGLQWIELGCPKGGKFKAWADLAENTDLDLIDLIELKESGNTQ